MKITREMLLDNIKPVLINVENSEELVAAMVHERVKEFAVCLKLVLMEEVSIRINHQFLEKLDISEEQLLEKARNNLRNEMSFEPIESHLVMEFPEMESELESAKNLGNPAMFVLTNEERIDGAALISDPIVMHDVREKVGEDFYILPSSKHEVLILPKNEMNDPCMLEEIVQDINRYNLDPKDWLGDHIYECDGNSLEMVDTRQLRIEQEEVGMDITM